MDIFDNEDTEYRRGWNDAMRKAQKEIDFWRDRTKTAEDALLRFLTQKGGKMEVEHE